MRVHHLDEEEDYLSLHDQRESQKMSLDTFSFDFESWLEREADETIRRLEKENRETLKGAEELEHIRKTDRKRWEELQEQASRSDIDLDYQINDQYYDNFLRSGVQYAFAEVKVIYAFQQLEIAVNRLLRASYPELKKGLGRFDDLPTFCQGKGITVKELEGFKEIEQLRKVGNALKHSGEIEDRIKDITEFKGKKEILFNDLETFYNRVKSFPKIFLTKLGAEIYEDLYEFSDERIALLAESYVLRMEKETATKFCQQLMKHYQ